MANYYLYDMKDMMPNLFSTESAFRAGRFMGKELDRPMIDEIIRPAKVSSVNPDTKTVTLEWLDVPGTQPDVLLNFPGVGRDWGIYFCPQVNDWCTCVMERGRVRILSWVPRNVRRLKNLQPGEVMIESAAQASIFFPKTGGMTIAAAPEKDNKPPDASIALDNPFNIPVSMINLGLPSPFSSDKQYEVQVFGQHGNNIFSDGLGNNSHYTSRNKTVRITGNLFTSIGMSSSEYIRKYKKTEIENDKDEIIRCAGVKHHYQLTVLKDFVNNIGAGYLKKIGTLEERKTNGKEDGMEKDTQEDKVYWISHVKIISPIVFFLYWFFRWRWSA